MEMKIPQYYGVQHLTNQFVDDSTNVVGTDTFEELNLYLNDFHKMLETYYRINKLKMNETKTKTMLTKTNAPNSRLKIHTTTGKTVTDHKAMKILGFVRNSRDNLGAHFAMLNSVVNKKLTELKPYLALMNLKNRRETVYSKVASIAQYGYELCAGANQCTQQKLTTVLMKCNKAIYNKCYMRVSNERLCRDIKVDPPIIMCKKAAVKLIHKIIVDKTPKQLFEKIKFNNKHRKCSKINLNINFRKEVSKSSLR